MLPHLQVSSWTFQLLKMGPVNQLGTSGIIIQWHSNTLRNSKYIKCSHICPKQLGLTKTLHLSNWWADKPRQFAPVIQNMFSSSKEKISCPFHFFFSEPQRWKSLEGRSGVNDEQDTLYQYVVKVSSITPSTWKPYTRTGGPPCTFIFSTKFEIEWYVYTAVHMRNILTCHTPTMALAMRISNITKGSTKAVIWSSCSSNKARTWNERALLQKIPKNTCITIIA